MSQENVEIVRRYFEAANRRDWSLVPELLDPDIEVDTSRNVFNPDVYRGYAGFRRFARQVEDTWASLTGVPAPADS